MIFLFMCKSGAISDGSSCLLFLKLCILFFIFIHFYILLLIFGFIYVRIIMQSVDFDIGGFMKYENPICEILKLNVLDTILTSPGGETGRLDEQKGGSTDTIPGSPTVS